VSGCKSTGHADGAPDNENPTRSQNTSTGCDFAGRHRALSEHRV